MKKILSSVLAAATLASMMVFPASAEVKSVTQEVQVLYMNEQPTFDGVITAEEWGEKSFTVSGANAAKPGDTAPSAENTFAWYPFEYDEVNKEIIGEDEENKAKTLGMSYDVWLRWDTKYLYLAAVVNDPDNYYLPSGREKIWDGDCLQFRIDPMGPNSYRSYKNPEYDYKAEGFDTANEITSGIGYYPWAYPTKICNVGLGIVNGDSSNSKNIQAYDMADQGTGNMTKRQLLNDPNKLGPGKNPLGDENDYASLFAMKTCKENGNGQNTYEYAIPWAFVDQWGFGQVAVGYAWGMSLVYLNGYDDGDSKTSPFMSYLTWGSGICGAQQDKSYLKATCGGSNAVILSDIDINGNKVEGLPYATDDIGGEQGEVIHRIIDAQGMDAYYLPGPYVTNGDYTISLDIAYLGPDPINPDRTWVGTFLGNGYSMGAGWDAETKRFFVAEQLFNNGINKDIPYSESAEEFDWVIGEWHNMTIDVLDETVTIYLDGKEVLKDTDKRNKCLSTIPEYQVVVYNIGDYVYDNYKVVSDGVVLGDYTCDTDDEEFAKSDFQLTALPAFHSFEKGECKNANPESKYGCLMHPDVNEDGKPVMKCDFCGTEELAAVTYGDADGNGKVNLNDASAVLKYIAKWDVTIDIVAADVDCNEKVNLNDVSAILKYIAKWDIVLGPKA